MNSAVVGGGGGEGAMTDHSCAPLGSCKAVKLGGSSQIGLLSTTIFLNIMPRKT